MSDEYNYTQETKSSPEKVAQREVLYKLFRERPMPDDQLLVSLGLYMRSSALAKILFVNELYGLISDIPGVIMEFGTWWGQNIILFENLRAIYETFNQSRRIIGFDTFKGYPGLSDKDLASDTFKTGGYRVADNYRQYLEDLLDYHEKENVLSNVKKHMIVEGDVVETVPRFFSEHPETVVALAYFDLALYEPTRVCLNAIKPHLIRGSVIMLDEFNWKDSPGETIAFKEVFSMEKFTIRRSRFMADRTFAIMD
jgi:hypothetical protein